MAVTLLAGIGAAAGGVGAASGPAALADDGGGVEPAAAPGAWAAASDFFFLRFLRCFFLAALAAPSETAALTSGLPA